MHVLIMDDHGTRADGRGVEAHRLHWTTLMEAQVQNLVDAMAAFSPPPPGQETLPPEYATQLNMLKLLLLDTKMPVADKG